MGWDLSDLLGTLSMARSAMISSGFDELAAQKVRGKTFRLAQTQRSYGTIDWLRRLHVPTLHTRVLFDLHASR